MPIVEWSMRKLALRKYSKILGPALRSKYGGLRSFSVDQVLQAAAEKQLTKKYILYAVVMFCTKKDYDDINIPSENTEDISTSYISMRSEIISHVALEGSFVGSCSDGQGGGDGGSEGGGGFY